MSTNWVTPLVNNLNTVMDEKILTTAEANVGDVDSPNAPVDPDAPLRSAALLAIVVTRIVQAVLTGARVPVSATAGAIPPEALQHCYVLVVWDLLAAKTMLEQVVIQGQHGNISPFYNMYQEATKWLNGVRDGSIVPTYPTDPAPTGVTGTADDQPVQVGIKWGDLYGTDAQYAAGTQKGAAPYDMTTD